MPRQRTAAAAAANAETAAPDSQLMLIPDEPMHGEYRLLRLDQLPPNDSFISAKPDAPMLKSVAQFGVMTPILVQPTPALSGELEILNRQFTHEARTGTDFFQHEDYIARREAILAAGSFQFLGGRRRVMSARAAGHTTISAIIFPAGVSHNGAITLIENYQRSDNAIVDLDVINRILAIPGAGYQEIYNATGLLPATAKKRMQLMNLIPELRAALLDGRMPLSVAETAARLSGSRQRSLLEGLMTNRRVKASDVRAVRQTDFAAAAAVLPTSLFAGNAPVAPGEARTPAASPSAGLYEQLRTVAPDISEEAIVAAASILSGGTPPSAFVVSDRIGIANRHATIAAIQRLAETDEQAYISQTAELITSNQDALTLTRLLKLYLGTASEFVFDREIQDALSLVATKIEMTIADLSRLDSFLENGVSPIDNDSAGDAGTTVSETVAAPIRRGRTRRSAGARQATNVD